MAQGILKYLFQREYSLEVEDYLNPGANKKGSIPKKPAKGKHPIPFPWLGDNIPNPFDHTTYIPFQIPCDAGNGKLLIFDMVGRMMKHYTLECEEKGTTIGLKGLESGVYFYSLFANGRVVQTKKMILMKK